MTAFALHEVPFAQRETSLSFEAAMVPSCISPTSALGRQQKMMRQRQLALTRQRNIVKNSASTIQQNDLPPVAERLPDYGHVLPCFGEPAAGQTIPTVVVTVDSATVGDTLSFVAENCRVADTDRPLTATTSVSAMSADLEGLSVGGPPLQAPQAATAVEHRQISTGNRKSAVAHCWDRPSRGEDSREPDLVKDAGPAKERPSHGRKFWRPWGSSKRSVSIAESHVSKSEMPSFVTDFTQESTDCTGQENLNNSLSRSGHLRQLASSSCRAPTPWGGALAAMDDEFPEFPVTLPGSMQDRPPSRVQAVQLPIMPRRHHLEQQDSWIGSFQHTPRPNTVETDEDAAPRSALVMAGESADANKVSSFEVD
jgi:hypothetical protein